MEQGVFSICCDTLRAGPAWRQLPEVQLLLLPVGCQAHLHVTQEETSLGRGTASEARGDELGATPEPPRSWQRWERPD